MEYPKLRPIEAFPAEMNGKEMICLRDPYNYSEKVLFVPSRIFEVIRLLDGHHSPLDIQEHYMRKFGELLYREKIDEIVGMLDSSLFLESDKFHDFRRQLEEEFLKEPIRKAFHAGKAYESNPEALKRHIEGFFTHPEGPGLPGQIEKGSIKGIVVPHIDFIRGGPTFAWAYKEVAESTEADLFIILGTAHGEARGFYTLTRKGFETPLGNLETDRDFVEALEREGGKGLFQGEIAHRAEHSIEFQAAFLRYLYPERERLRMVPILCGSFSEIMAQGKAPEEEPLVSGFIQALRGTIEISRDRVLVISGADLSHVGPRFGDREPITPGILRWIAQADLEMLGYGERLDAEGFYRSVARDKDRRICGLSSIYTLLKVIDAKEGRLLKYSQWSNASAAVTFAAMAFY